MDQDEIDDVAAGRAGGGGATGVKGHNESQSGIKRRPQETHRGILHLFMEDSQSGIRGRTRGH